METVEHSEEQQPKDLKEAGIKWLKEIDRVLQSKEQRAFERIGDRIVKKYRNADAIQLYDTNTGSARVMLNSLWTVVQIMQPILYARTPQVVVEREFKDKDDVARVAAMICERATSSCLRSQQDRFNYVVKSAVLDRLLPGRGQGWIRYVADKDESNQVLVGSERVIYDPVNWHDYLESPARNQYEIRWRAKRAHMTRQALINAFGEEIGRAIKLGTEDKTRKTSEDDEIQQAEVWEIWDQETKSVIHVSPGYKESALSVRPDILHLDDFYPCPIPLLATTVTDTTYPTPDFKIYERLADEVDYVTKRIASIVDCVRLVGMAAADVNNDVVNMLKLSDGQLWPKEGWTSFAEKGGMKGLVDWMPIEQAANVLPVLINYQQHCLSIIFEQIIGITDIMRGASDPNDSVTAQEQKGQYASIRVQEKQADVRRFVRELVSKTGEILFQPGLFSDETLMLMAGVGQFSEEDRVLVPNALSILRNDRLRTFKIDIETDSTIAVDEATDKSARIEFLSAVTQMFGQVQAVVQFAPEMLKPMLESALFAARSFRAGRSVEGSFEQAIELIVAAQKNPPPPPPPDYEAQKLQIEAQKAQNEFQIQTGKLQIEGSRMQSDSMEAQSKLQIELKKLELEAQKLMSAEQTKIFEAQLEKFKEDFKQFAETQRLQIEKYSVVLSEREKVMEEARLKQEQMLRAAEVLASKQPAEQKAPIVNIIQEDSEKEVELARDATGMLRGRSRKIRK